MVPWKNLTDSYNQFEAGTIGNDIFPSYKLYVESTSGSELTDGMTITSSTLKIVCKSDKCDLFIGNTDKLQPITIYDKDGIQTADVDNKGVASVNLNQGANKIGIYVQGLKSDAKKYYIDFKWITVNYNQSTQPKLVITPNPLEGLKNKKYKFVAALEGAALPAKPKYLWGMDAHGTTITVYNNDTLEYKYKDTGTYPIQVSLYDSVTGIPIAYGSSQAWNWTSWGGLFPTRSICLMEVLRIRRWILVSRQWEKGIAIPGRRGMRRRGWPIMRRGTTPLGWEGGTALIP